jgi:hypothetical protein
MKGSRPLGRAVSRRLRRLDGVLGIDHAGRSEWFWAIPALVLLGTVAGFLVIGQITTAPLTVSLPNGVVIALVMAGLSVACMSPADDNPSGDGPPGDGGDAPVLGSPGGPWMLVAHLTPPTDDRLPDADALSSGGPELVAAGGHERARREDVGQVT